MAVNDRKPLSGIAKKVSKVIGALGGIVSVLVTSGFLSASEGAALTDLFSSVEGVGVLVSGLVASATGVWAAFTTSKEGEKSVTPVADPRDNAGRRLVPRE